MKRRWLLSGAIAVSAVIWAATVAAAYQAIRRFESTPGTAAIAPGFWPGRSTIEPRRGEWSLVMLVHPHCSCSRASIKELEAVLEKAPRSVRPAIRLEAAHGFAGRLPPDVG